MKRCPTCSKTYSDDSMSFCLEDGAPLLTVGGGGADAHPSGGFDPNLTIPFTPPRDTSEPRPPQTGGQWGAGAPGTGPQSGQAGQSGSYGQSGGSGYGQQGGQYSQRSGQYNAPASGQFPPPPQSNQYQPAPSWTPQPPPGYTTKKKSSALPWVLGTIGALVVIGIVGAVIIGVLASMGSNSNKSNSNNSNRTSNRSSSNSSNPSNSNNSNSTANSSTTPSLRDDFSSKKWWTGTVNIGTAAYTGGEYRLNGISGGYIAVYSSPTAEYTTTNARTLVTARSVTGESPSLGYGLAVYCEMKNNQLEDYSFLIRTDASSPAYRVVLHQGGKETVLVNWTSSSVIRTGTSPNQLEVRADGKQLAFYINGQYVTSVTDTANYGAGYVGLYTSDSYEIAFDDLEIYR